MADGIDASDCHGTHEHIPCIVFQHMHFMEVQFCIAETVYSACPQHAALTSYIQQSALLHCCTEVLLVLTLHVKSILAAMCACNAICTALAITTSLADADDVFRLLHLTVAVLFSEQIQKDLAVLKAGKPSDVSLAAKWAPTPASKAPLTSTLP